MSSTHTPGMWLTYRTPALLAIASSIGLIAALVGDGLLDIVGWTCLLLPLLVAASCFARTKAPGSVNPPRSSGDPSA